MLVNVIVNVSKCNKFHLRAIKSVTFRSETPSNLAPKIWELVLVEIKNVESVGCFKRAIKKRKTMKCPCRICRTYVFQVGLVQQTCFTFFPFFFFFIILVSSLFYLIFSFCNIRFDCLFSCIYVYCIFANLSTLNK